MSAVTLTMPRLGETMEEGRVSAWLVAEGERFERGTPLIEFETDKTAVEYPALGSGRLLKALVGKGDLVRLGEPIAEIGLEGGADWVSVEDGAAAGGDTVIIELLMPRLGETMEEGKITGFLVEPGARFERGAAILEVETDKTVAEFPALAAGRLIETLVEPGQTVPVDTPIARIEVARADAPAAGGTGPERPQEAAHGGFEPPARPGLAPARRPGEPVRATPLARRAARRAGLRIDGVRGTGRRGRIELADVERALSGGTASGLAETAWGPAGGAPVLLVHGYAGDRTTFDQLGRGLGRAGLSVRAIDLPSHGETDGDAEDFAALVDALSAELDPRSPVHVVGHSLGAAAAVVAAARKGGVASLILIAPAGLGPDIDAEFVAGMADAQSVETVGGLLRRLSERAASFSPEAVAAIHASLARGRLKGLAGDFCAGGRQTVDVRDDLARLADTLPVRILVGARDRIVNWRDALEVSPAIALHVFAQAGHMPHWDAPAEVAAIIAKAVGDG